MGLTVHVVDGGNEASGKSDKSRFLENSDKYGLVQKSSLVIHIGLMCDGVKQVIADIQNAIGKQKISNLFISGHGFPGFVALGSGTGKELLRKGMNANELKGANDERLRSAISVAPAVDDDADDQAMARWRELRPHFATDGRVIITGCRSGRGDNGKRLISALSRALGVPVSASEAYEFIGAPMTGKINTASPDGTVTANEKTGRHNLTKLPILDRVIIGSANKWADLKDGQNLSPKETLIRDFFNIPKAQ